MARVPDNQIAEALIAILRQAGHDAVEATARIVIERAQADIPRGDPHLDPNQAISLRESVGTEWDHDTYRFGFYTSYSVKQHELLGFRHPRGGRPKFLERNMTNIGPEFQAELRERVKQYFAT